MTRKFDYLPDVEVFLMVVEHGSFSTAAIALSTTPSVLSRALTRLESRLGCQLLRRTTRRLNLTDAGQVYWEQMRNAFDSIDNAKHNMQQQQASIVGSVKISAPTTYGNYRLPKLLQTFCDAYPHVQVELNVSNRNVDLNAEGFDMAIRLGELPDSSLVGQKLEDAKLCLVASPDYLKRSGSPLKLKELDEHQCLPFVLPSTGRVMPWLLRENNQDVDYYPKGRIHTTDDVLGVVSLAQQGVGICQTFEFIAQRHLSQGTLVEVLPQLQGRSRPFSLIYAPHSKRSTASRALIDSLVNSIPT